MYHTDKVISLSLSGQFNKLEDLKVLKRSTDLNNVKIGKGQLRLII